MSAYDPYRRKVLIIQSRFYPDISDEIFKGAKLVLERKATGVRVILKVQLTTLSMDGIIVHIFMDA